MFHRSVRAAALAMLPLLFSDALAMERPYRVSLVGDAFAGGQWQTGILIELEDGWKTYWRMPGAAGISPQFTWSSSAPAAIEVLYPVPGRYADASGETVGYQQEVVFPVLVTADAATGVKLDLDLFFAVCREICIPAQAKAALELQASQRDLDGSRRVEEWRTRVPVAGTAVGHASVDMEDGKPVLRLGLLEPVADIFVETETQAYFRAPQFSADGREARLIIDNVADAAKLKGAMLKLTFNTAAGGLEQSLTLP